MELSDWHRSAKRSAVRVPRMAARVLPAWGMTEIALAMGKALPFRQLLRWFCRQTHPQSYPLIRGA